MMSRLDSMFDTLGDEEYFDRLPTTTRCARCGATGLVWIDGGNGFKLVEDNGKRHECHRASPADFEVIE